MLFSSNVFLFYFLPLCIVLYYIADKKYRNHILLLFSIFFYAWGEPVYILLMIVSIFMNYIFALLIDYFRDERRVTNIILVITILGNLSILGYYKYSSFFIKNINMFLGLNIPVKELALPIGISFYTFQALSYVIDIKRGNGKVQKNPINVALYISFFPQLVAGPIVRYEDISNQLENRIESVGLFNEGAKRFIYGLGKKMILSNTFAILADTAFAKEFSTLPIGFAWLGAVSYTMQIYFDFSGYSDMAIGLGKMFGFQFSENFNYPYMSRSITEFWRRWHISLSTWFRDYVYIPLGGNRKGAGYQVINLLVVWGLTGLWHGANWTFIAWGMYYFCFLIIEKAWLKDIKKIPVLSNIYALVIIIVGWVLFRAETITDACNYIKAMFGMGMLKQVYSYQLGYYLYEYKGYLIIGILACISWKDFEFVQKLREKWSCLGILEYCLLAFILIWCVALLASNSYNPFIYFNF